MGASGRRCHRLRRGNRGNRDAGTAQWSRPFALGVATPAQLIKDRRRTPFNIGHRIELTDFTPEEARPLADNPQVEARLKTLAVELRCLVCQNQTLADSNAPLAEDLRREVREMITKGMSDREIIDFLVQRYGDFVLYRPPWKATTTLLWLGPFLLLIAGATALVLALRRRQKKLANVTLSEAEHNRVAQLLSEGANRP